MRTERKYLTENSRHYKKKLVVCPETFFQGVSPAHLQKIGSSRPYSELG